MQKGNKKGTLYESVIRISSSNRVPGNNYSSSNFLFDVGQNLQMVHKISIVHVAFFNNFYNITDTNEANIFYVLYTYSGTGYDFTITITPGRYNTSTLITAIQSVISTLPGSPNIVFSIDPITGLCTVTFTPGAITSVQLLTPYLVNPSETGLLFYLGFAYNLSAITLNSTTPTNTATGMPKLYGPQELYINSSTLFPSNMTDDSGRYSNAGLAVPITAPYQGLNTWECKVDSLCSREYGMARRLNQIDIQLMDRNNNILDLHDGSFTMIMKVWYNVY